MAEKLLRTMSLRGPTVHAEETAHVVDGAHRRLFDYDFLASDCRPDLFRVATNVDDTFATYSTNYLIAYIGCYYAWKLYQTVKKTNQMRRRLSRQFLQPSSTSYSSSSSLLNGSGSNSSSRSNTQTKTSHTTISPIPVLSRKHYLFSGGFLLFHSLGHIIAGAAHQMTKEKGQIRWGAQQLGLLVIGWSGVCLVQGGGMELWRYHSFASHQRTVPRWLIWLEHIWLASSSAAVCVGAFFKSFIVVSVLIVVGILLLKAGILMHYWQTRRDRRRRQQQQHGTNGIVSGTSIPPDDFTSAHHRIYQYQALAAICYFGGFGFQLGWKGVCGSGGYKDCFAQCPLPAPTFNHNALFHIFAALSIYLYGKSKILQLELLSLPNLTKD